jgi:hypothetical protein
MSQLSDWAAGVLETDEEIVVPVKKLWKVYIARDSNLSVEALMLELESDARFEFMDGSDPEERFDDWSEQEIAEYEEEMETRGYFNGPRVKLKSRELSAEHIAKMIAKHTDRIVQSLWSMYDARPEDLNEDAVQELLDIMVRAKKFQLDAEDATKKDGNNK